MPFFKNYCEWSFGKMLIRRQFLYGFKTGAYYPHFIKLKLFIKVWVTHNFSHFSTGYVDKLKNDLFLYYDKNDIKFP